tara:strand:+ start:4301 stop:4621 length:321 start_codon:yes stop_codon:yes gene_type:complete
MSIILIIVIIFFAYLIFNHLFKNKIIEGYEEHEKVDLEISESNNKLSKYKKKYSIIKNKINKQQKTINSMKKRILDNRKALKQTQDMMDGEEYDNSNMCESQPDAC